MGMALDLKGHISKGHVIFGARENYQFQMRHLKRKFGVYISVYL